MLLLLQQPAKSALVSVLHDATLLEAPRDSRNVRAVCIVPSICKHLCPQVQYHLHGIINHLGMGPSSGHFTADIFEQESGRWLRHNDSAVSELASINGTQAAKDCYMLVYMCDSSSDFG